jgi:hypothetical protein
VKNRLYSIGLVCLFGLLLPVLGLALSSYHLPQAYASESRASLVSSSLFTSASQTFTPTWATERVNADKTFDTMSSRSLALDNANHPHLAYGTDHLYYARYNGSQWLKETVDPTWGTGWYASLALDSHDYPHISYRDDTNADLKYAYYDGSRWHREVIDSSGDVGSHTSLALDGNNHPHILYYDSTNQRLKYAYFDGSVWHFETFDARGTTGSIALDHLGRPHISYARRWSGLYELGYAYKTGITWTLQTVVTASVNSTSIALDSADVPYIGYHDSGKGKMMYAVWSGSAWVTETVESGISWGSAFVSIAVDTQQRPQLVYRKSASQELRYASRPTETWNLETVSSAGDDSSLTLDSSDKPVVSYQDSATGALRLAQKVGAVWNAVTVDQSSIIGAYVSLALEPTAPYTPHMSYAGGTDLRYATYQANVWHISTVDNTRIAGTSLALSPAAPYSPHIAYYTYDGKVNYASWTGGTWLIETIDPAGEAMWGISLALASTAPYTPHVAYMGDGGNLKHAYRTGSGWTLETVDYWTDSFFKLESPSIALAFTAPYTPGISYHNTDTGELIYAHYAGTGWITETVGSTGNTCEPTSLALDRLSNNPHIAYFEWSALKYLRWTGATWALETLDGDVSSCDGASLALDTNNRPHIAYAGTRSLRYAQNDNNAWITDTVDSPGALGAYTSLALDGDNRPRIAYYDYTNGDLKFAWKTRLDTIAPSGSTIGAYSLATFQFPAGAVTETCLLTYTALQPSSVLPHAGVFFDLNVTSASSGQPAQIAPGQTYTVVVHYDEANVPTYVNEADLALYFWNGTRWIKEPTSVVDTVNNTITATPNHFSAWAALFTRYFIYLPLTLRN